MPLMRVRSDGSIKPVRLIVEVSLYKREEPAVLVKGGVLGKERKVAISEEAGPSGHGPMRSAAKRDTRLKGRSPYYKPPAAAPAALPAIAAAPPTLGLSSAMGDMVIDGPISSRTRRRLHALNARAIGAAAAVSQHGPMHGTAPAYLGHPYRPPHPSGALLMPPRPTRTSSSRLAPLIGPPGGAGHSGSSAAASRAAAAAVLAGRDPARAPPRRSAAMHSHTTLGLLHPAVAHGVGGKHRVGATGMLVAR